MAAADTIRFDMSCVFAENAICVPSILMKAPLYIIPRELKTPGLPVKTATELGPCSAMICLSLSAIFCVTSSQLTG